MDLVLAMGAAERHPDRVPLLLRVVLLWSAVSVVVGPLVGSVLHAGSAAPVQPARV